MRIGICGGGPAGLYFSILMKRVDPAIEVAVFERNPPGATYGWGVVFSDESLAELRDADYETYLAIDRALVRWSAIDIHYRGERIRSFGHGFAAIARRELLRVLSERAAALGVDVRFEHELGDPACLAGFDVAVGADGVRSVVRGTVDFGTTFSEHSSRYVWFGADVALPVFTFIFQPTEHGLFQVHAYPFDASASTFIVECTDETWRRAGLDAMSEEESLAFCQDLFDPYLGGHRLMSNRSTWNTFVTVRNRTWHAGNAVLVGDAAHTAHFSIGSGTRLAMDDAIALAKAFVAFPRDRTAAFAEYEGARQPIVERFQEVATDSSHYFESVSRYLGFEAEQFAFNLLTRSGRITHLNLTQRDPAFVNRVDRWFARAPAQQVLVPPPLLAPLALAPGCELANRVVLAPAPVDDAVDGRPAQGAGAGASLAAAGGAGAALAVTEPVAPSPEGRVTSGSAGIWTDGQAAAWAGVVKAVHGAGSRVALRLAHAGRRGATAPRRRGLDRPLPDGEGWPLLAASAVPYTTRSRVPRAIDRAGMDAVVEAYASAAARAAGAGFDVLLLDASDGYLLAGFLSPLANRRGDGYGGAVHARLRFPLEVLAAVRAAWPEDRPLGVRLVAADGVAGGLSPADGVTLARSFVDAGAGFVDVASGHSTGDERGAADYRRLYRVGLADRIRNEVGVPVMVGGHITRLDEVNTVVASGRADLCVLDPRLYIDRRPAP